MASRGPVAVVFGGGGHLGACQVGMLRALLERGVQPDLVIGTSVGAINGAMFACDPAPRQVDRLGELWQLVVRSEVFGASVLGRLGTLARTRTSLHHNASLRRGLEHWLAVERIEELPVRFECVAASIERAAEHWFTEGALVPAVLASCAVPGLLPPVELAGEHFLDGGIVNSIPVGRAVQLGARDVYVLQVGRVEQPLSPPRWPWEVALVAFEIARRHRFTRDLASLPEGVRVHVLPTGDRRPIRFNDLSQLRYRDFSQVADRIRYAYEASGEYLRQAGG